VNNLNFEESVKGRMMEFSKGKTTILYYLEIKDGSIERRQRYTSKYVVSCPTVEDSASQDKE
jgi:hypothetical protein